MKRTYLNICYDEEDRAKQFGAKWDASKEQWYITGSFKTFIDAFTGMTKYERKVKAFNDRYILDNDNVPSTMTAEEYKEREDFMKKACDILFEDPADRYRVKVKTNSRKHKV